ncbi:MAG: hypothetical protein QF369_01760, partial [Dehalococcoidales bacterium]|nr:hypothetical protein [Dehalococcoidales bacterium]
LGKGEPSADIETVGSPERKAQVAQTVEAARAEAEAAITEEVEPAAVAEPRPAPTKALAQIQAELEADIAIAKNRIADIRVELPTQGTVII